jgi:hypothetical protein
VPSLVMLVACRLLHVMGVFISGPFEPLCRLWHRFTRLVCCMVTLI